MDVEDRAPDVVFLCGAGTNWDSKMIITEDGFGSADFVDLQTLQLVVPRRPKLLVAVGAYCDEFGATAVELGVCSTVLVLNDLLPPGASDSYELISLLFKEFVRVNGREDVATVVKRSIASMDEHKGGTTQKYARLYTALRAVAPPQKLVCNLGACRVKDTEGAAAIRARQNARVFRLRVFDGQAQLLSDTIDAFERKCTHNQLILYGGAGCGRTELASQVRRQHALSRPSRSRPSRSHVLMSCFVPSLPCRVLFTRSLVVFCSLAPFSCFIFWFSVLVCTTPWAPPCNPLPYALRPLTTLPPAPLAGRREEGRHLKPWSVCLFSLFCPGGS